MLKIILISKIEYHCGIKKLKHIFIFIFCLSITTLTLQNTLLELCKNYSVLKKSLTNNLSEEEEEKTEKDTDEKDSSEEKELCASYFNQVNLNISTSQIFYIDYYVTLCSNVLSKHTPPPKA